MGRPRNVAIDDTILLATIEVVAARGLADATSDEIAARAHVGKDSIYRRWPGKRELFVAMADRLATLRPDLPDTGFVMTDLERYLGNPRTELDTMKQTSPLYEYARLTAPVMLAHGEEDERVDFEHTRRLVRMLDLAGRPPVLMTFPKEGHSFDKFEDEEKLWTGIAGFLHEQLDSTAKAAPAAVQAGSP